MPDTTVRIASTEAVSLGLDVSDELSAVRLLPRFADDVTISLSDGVFDFPRFDTPEAVTIEWLASGSTEAAYVSKAEVVSRHYFSLQDLRGYGDGQDDFDDAVKYPDQKLYEARQAAEETFEGRDAANRSFVRRVGTTRDYGRGCFLQLDDVDIYEMLTDGYMLVSDCQAERTAEQASYPCDVEYLYGLGDIPAKVSSAVLTLAAYLLRPSNTSDRASGESSDAGYIHFTLAGVNGATALPEVNATAEQFGRAGQLIW